jgi:hypothetical protein
MCTLQRTTFFSVKQQQLKKDTAKSPTTHGLKFEFVFFDCFERIFQEEHYVFVDAALETFEI